MDIERLRQILKELDPIFWNAKIDRQLQKENYANHTPIQSALGRYLVVLCDTPRKERFDKLLEELKECLKPYDKVYDVLRKEFTSSFAEQVLLTHEDRVRNFDSISLNGKDYKAWARLVVCMSHKDFWMTLPPASGGKSSEEIQGTSKSTKQKVGSIRDQVFISYSHKDERWLNDLQTRLKPYVRNGSVTAWSDKKIPPGSKWFSKIEAALASAKVAVFLVTPDFLASDFIHENELEPLLKKAEKGRVKIIWIPVRPSAYKKTKLKDYQPVIDPGKPLAEMTRPERDEAWVRICDEIEKAVEKPANR